MQRHRVVVIGLDGVPLDLLRPWMESGQLPILGQFARHGAVGHLHSTMPPTSGPSWSSFMTGKNPGKTGIYDFLYRADGGYRFPPVNASLRHGQELCDLLGQAGYRVGMLNVPLTYPVKPVNGFMVSGWMTPYTARDYVYPASLGPELTREIGNYHIYPTTTYVPGREEHYLKASIELLEMRTRTALYLLRREAWDFFMTVIFDTDRVLHQLWHLIDPEHPWHQRAGTRRSEGGEDVLLAYFSQLDRCLAQLLDAAGEDALKIVMSDHGMGSAHHFVVLNNWLLEKGFLCLRRGPWTAFKRALFRAGVTLRNVHRAANWLGLAKHAEYKGLYSTDWLLKLAFLSFSDVDWSESVAYSFGRHYGPVYINLKGREPGGIVEPGAEYEQVREQVIAAALAFKHPRTDRKMVGHVLKREEIYHGPYLGQAPDLILIPTDPRDIFFGLADFGSNRVVDTVYRYSGMHRDYGSLLMMGPQVAAGTEVEGATIYDLAPTVLHVMGVPIPDDMDGRPLLHALHPAYRDRRPSHVRADGDGDQPKVTLSEQEEKQIIERLRGLGYLG